MAVLAIPTDPSTLMDVALCRPGIPRTLTEVKDGARTVAVVLKVGVRRAVCRQGSDKHLCECPGQAARKPHPQSFGKWQDRDEGRAEMGAVASWIVGGLLAVLGITGLFLSSRAEDHIIYYTGLIFFGFSVLFIFHLIARHTEQEPDL